MPQTFAVASLWFALAAFSGWLASVLRFSSALLEIVVGVAATAVAERYFGAGAGIGASLPWVTFLGSTGSVALTFLAGAELDPDVLRRKWKEVNVVGLVGFLAPFLGAAAVARFVLGWSPPSSWLAGIALSTTSMAVVYAVMLETGLNGTEYGKGILGACFVNDLGTVIALGLLFAPFSFRVVAFIVITLLAVALLPWLTRLLSRAAAEKAELQTRWLLVVMFGLGALAAWAGSEAVLPAYVAGMALAGSVGRDPAYIRRLRTLVIGFLSPVYFLRAGSLVRLGTLLRAPATFGILLGAKVVSKIFGLYPVVGIFRRGARERWFYTLLMSTGLTFGTISALFGLSHRIVDEGQYSLLVAAVIASAVIPTLIANAAFLPRHLLPAPSEREAPGQGE